ncbi:hypothetical protein GCM10010145_13890 [Streptomyces ruber]|uniref:DUF418 domain-containing protein n=2 Tax=Streptomyces TaxID=1883 RepID=A0A918B8T3_9ACTN|nr:DUF418 domain-containing protein [Streptomyces ruber]GGQ46400.1 hypothetical protein GCM10010145_13890 [Streptomyces ruber]
MTHHASPVAPSAAPPGPETGRAPSGAPSADRLTGIDLARGIAVLGMFSAHIGPDVTVGGPVGFLLELARGRSSALFAVLAGFSLVALTGRPQPRTGLAGRQARARVAVRALVLIPLGYVLIALDTSVDVILVCYGLLFLIVLPLHRLRAGTLALLAVSGALILPQAWYAIRASMWTSDWADAVVAVDPLARLTGTDGFVDLLFTGGYPVITWIPFVLAGMAVARLLLDRPGIRTRLALTGGGLALLGYGGSWLALHLAGPGALRVVSSAADGHQASAAWWSDTVGGVPEGRIPLDWMLVASPHSQTTLSILGNTGTALVVITACLTVVARLPRLARLATPVIAVGRTALTAYVLHIVALWVLSDAWYVPAVEDQTMGGLPALLAFMAAAVLLATCWTHCFRRGPLEHLMHTTGRCAQYIR